MINFKHASIAAAIAFALTASAPAQAGGLFGKKGLIRGSIGAFVEKRVNPIVTPILRQTYTTAVGVVVGGLAGAPAISGVIGATAGHGINEAAK